MLKVVMLDMDGVVNSTKHDRAVIAQLWEEAATKNLTEDLASEWVRKQFVTRFAHSTELVHPELAQRVTDIITATGASIVWSSSWRCISKYKDIEAAREMFNRRGLPGASLIGYTPKLPWGLRYEEINKWLGGRDNVEKCAVIDDCASAGYNLEPRAKFFQTNLDEGLTEELKRHIIEYLNN